MADKFGLGNEVKPLKLGQSFTNSKATAFHTIRYDFKPASVDTNKIASVEVGSNNQVTVTVPHLDGAGVPQTVFKGSQRPYQKECILIIDRVTGDVTLEKLSSNIQVKKTRSESIKPQLPQAVNNGDRSHEKPSGTFTSNRPQTPPIGQRTSSKTRVTSGCPRPCRSIPTLPVRSPVQASPNYSSPNHYKSPKRDHHPNIEAHPPSLLASLPMIGDDFKDTTLNVPQVHNNHLSSSQKPQDKSPSFVIESDFYNDPIGEISDSSSSSSESDMDTHEVVKPPNNGYSNGLSNSNTNNILTQDLCLSDTESE